MPDIGASRKGPPTRDCAVTDHLRWFAARIDWFAIVYVAGVFLMTTGNDGPLGWMYVRAVAWAVGAPAFYIWGIHDGALDV